MQIGEVSIHPFIFFQFVNINIPGKIVDHLLMGLDILYNLEITIEYFDSSIRKANSQQAFNFTGKECQINRYRISLDFLVEGKGFAFEFIEGDLLVDTAWS